jgi:hypothetical protein
MSRKPRAESARGRKPHAAKPNTSVSDGKTGPRRRGATSSPTLDSLAPAVATERTPVPPSESAAARASRSIPDADIALYREKLPTWAGHQGKHVLIHEGKIHGFYSARLEALRAGFEPFGHIAFLVKEVDLDEKPRPLIGVVL